MIEAQNLVKCFGDFTALSSLTTSIPRGSVYGLVGSNGSGKSTFLRLCAGVYMPDGGSIAVDGQKVYENTAVKQTVFFIADDLYFLPQSSLRDMARFYAQSYPGYSQERFERLLDVFPLDPAAKLATFSKLSLIHI